MGQQDQRGGASEQPSGFELDRSRPAPAHESQSADLSVGGGADHSPSEARHPLLIKQAGIIDGQLQFENKPRDPRFFWADKDGLIGLEAPFRRHGKVPDQRRNGWIQIPPHPIAPIQQGGRSRPSHKGQEFRPVRGFIGAVREGLHDCRDLQGTAVHFGDRCFRPGALLRKSWPLLVSVLAPVLVLAIPPLFAPLLRSSFAP